MELSAGLFADTEAAYRSERISASFRDHAAKARLQTRRQRRQAAGRLARRSLRAA
jgi:hypothetical protein